MAEASPSPAPAAAPAPAPTAPVKPDYVPADFWNTQKNEVDVQGMATKYTEISQRFAKGKEALIPEIKAEVHKEIFGKRPETPEMYVFTPPKDGPLAEKLSKSNLVLLPEKPGPEFQAEKGKVYYIFDQKGPLFQFGRQLAHKAGMSNDEFVEMAAGFVEIEALKESAAQKATSDRLTENRKLLGENGDKRIDYIKNKIKTIAGDKASEALDIDFLPSSAIEAIEKILEKAGEPKFSAGQGGPQPKDNAALLEEAAKLQIAPDYWESPSKQARVLAIFEQTNPGPAIPGTFKKKA